MDQIIPTFEKSTLQHSFNRINALKNDIKIILLTLASCGYSKNLAMAKNLASFYKQKN